MDQMRTLRLTDIQNRSHIYTHTHMQVYIYIYIYVYIYVYIHRYTCVYIYTRLCSYIRVTTAPGSIQSKRPTTSFQKFWNDVVGGCGKGGGVQSKLALLANIRTSVIIRVSFWLDTWHGLIHKCYMTHAFDCPTPPPRFTIRQESHSRAFCVLVVLPCWLCYDCGLFAAILQCGQMGHDGVEGEGCAVSNICHVNTDAYVDICVHIYTYMYIHIYVCIHAHVYIFIRIWHDLCRPAIYLNVGACMRVHVCVCTCRSLHACVCVCVTYPSI